MNASRQMPDLIALAARLSAHGLILRGHFNFDPGEAAPAGPCGAAARAVALVGHAGPSIWPHFKSWRERRQASLKDPLDSWSREVIGAVAQQVGARSVSPSDRPFLPFQQWAMRAEGLRPSPLGILMHPEYGLWHAYRGALLFDDEFAVPATELGIHLCALCADKPCLTACPVEAYSPSGFMHQTCVSHVRSANGQACRQTGCLARNACPHGAAYRYPAEAQAFHMESFAGGER